MTDNVIILGAGASVDAGIPLLSNFVDKMWEIATRGKYNDKELSDDDKKIFDEAMKIRNELDGYHGRASFDDRNIEDILSILSFNLMAGEESDRNKLNWMIKAITRTIELTCEVKHGGQLDKIQDDGSNIYRTFWENLFTRFQNSETSFPSIISFNYDLVMERALFQILIGKTYNNEFESRNFPFDGINLKYQYRYLNNISYSVKYVWYDNSEKVDHERIYGRSGITLEKCGTGDLQHPIDIEILKLHGSLNFPSTDQIGKSDIAPTIPAEEPHIIPPIINKSISAEQTMWSAGLKRLREAKNIIIVGYSLPQTDIYMQYFIKAGIGPNTNLNRIFVFNPALQKGSEENERMRERFGNCFSPQLRNRIVFNEGTFYDFVESIGYSDNGLFFT
ncbi:MAG TPA: hypothetical protein VIN60_01465 [Anaerolineales bacterium]